MLQRLDSLQRQEGLSDTDESLRYNKITRRIAAALSVYQNLVFNPQRYYPSKMSDLLNQAGGFSGHSQSSYNTAFGAWNSLMSIGDDSSITATAQIGNTEQMVHPVMERWHAVARKITQLASAFDRTDDKNNRITPNLNAVEHQFELLLKAVDVHLGESAALMEKIYPGITFRQNTKEDKSEPVSVEKLLPKLFTAENLEKNKETITQLVLTYHYSVKQLRSEIEAAYLALYDDGRTLRVLPLIHSSFASDSDLLQTRPPWASMQFVLHGGDAAIRRFLDPDFFSVGNIIQKTETDEKDKEDEKKPLVIPG
ncbi:hypothetical protein FACS189427_13840 [Planctomycetales bacterium]|nr:hypothetical protein FACS189427_13840 [Planctomycetales bacterium]